MPMPTARILAAILAERQHQDRKYGAPAERNLSIADYWRIARAELDEVAQAIGCLDQDAALCEMVQVAAVAWTCLERHGLICRPPLKETTIDNAIADDEHVIYPDELRPL